MKFFLFLDDDDIRHAVFAEEFEKYYKQPEDYLVCHAYSLQETIDWLKLDRQWEILFLDHDLGMEDTMCTPGVDNRYATGSDVANYIMDNNVITKAIVLHSYNPAGVRQMTATLQSRYPLYPVPFGLNYPSAITDLL